MPYVVVKINVVSPYVPIWKDLIHSAQKEKKRRNTIYLQKNRHNTIICFGLVHDL